MVVVGAGMGGLASAIRLARVGVAVTVVEASAQTGGLAGSVVHEGLRFDGGPYILLDLPGLQWAFSALGLVVEEHLALRKIEDVYEVAAEGRSPVRFLADAHATAEGLERSFPGSAKSYLAYVAHVTAVNDRLRPTLTVSHPGVLDLLKNGALLQGPFLLRSLSSVLRATGLPHEIIDAIAIWTHVAGQTLEEAPSPLAFVPALIHGVGAYHPRGGIGAIPRLLEAHARSLGVDFRLSTRVRAIRREGRRVTAVETDQGGALEADAIVSNASAVGTYLELVDGTPARAARSLRALPLQSPGVCAYLSIASSSPRTGPYLHFRLAEGASGTELTRVLIRPHALPGALDDDTIVGERAPARILGPMRRAAAQEGEAAQQAYLERILAEPWWRAHVDDARVVATNTPKTWGEAHHLHAESMNPVMTGKFMRQGRIAHRSPHFDGLYLAGSSTHPGQWVSFTAISGVLAADRLREDLGC
ncbi:MAG: NAD(P)/FAD-dependent oxidoreductase [Polyangiales bacterium]